MIWHKAKFFQQSLGAIIGLLLSSTPLLADSLFSEIPNTRSHHTRSVTDEVVSEKAVSIDTSVLYHRSFDMQIGGKEYRALNIEPPQPIVRDLSAPAKQSAGGKILDENLSVGHYSLSWRRDDDGYEATYGVFHLGEKLYRIQADQNGTHFLQELNPEKFPNCPHDHGHSHFDDIVTDHDSAPPVQARSSGDMTYIDIMFVYTPAARANEGGTAAMLSKIDVAVELANTAYENSNVDVQLRLVHTHETVDSESSSFSSDLYALAYHGDGRFDEVQGIQDQYGADVVSMIRTPGQYCGIGYLPNTWSLLQYGITGYNVTAQYCVSGHTVTHEIGHNLGLHHNRENGGSNVIFNYAYGDHFTSGNRLYRTVMAYAPGLRVPYFSGPDVLYGQVPTGTSNDNNAAVIRLTAPVVADYRESVIDLPGADVLKVVAKTPSGTPISGAHIRLRTGPSSSQYTSSKVKISGPDGTVFFKNLTRNDYLAVTAAKGGITFTDYTQRFFGATTARLTGTPQNYSVSVTVVDQSNLAVSGVQVLGENGTVLGTTDSDGKYEAQLPYGAEYLFHLRGTNDNEKVFPLGEKLRGVVMGDIERRAVVYPE